MSKVIGQNAASLLDLLGGDEQETLAVVSQCPRILAVRDLKRNVQALAELMEGNSAGALEVLRSKPVALLNKPSRMRAARAAGFSLGSK